MKAGGQVRTTIIKFTLVIPFTGSPELLCEALPVLAPQTALFGQFVKVNDDRPSFLRSMRVPCGVPCGCTVMAQRALRGPRHISMCSLI